MNKLSAPARLVGAIVLAFALGGATIALAVGIPSEDGRIFGCYDSKHGDLRVVSSTDTCEKSETVPSAYVTRVVPEMPPTPSHGRPASESKDPTPAPAGPVGPVAPVAPAGPVAPLEP